MAGLYYEKLLLPPTPLVEWGQSLQMTSELCLTYSQTSKTDFQVALLILNIQPINTSLGCKDRKLSFLTFLKLPGEVSPCIPVELNMNCFQMETKVEMTYNWL